MLPAAGSVNSCVRISLAQLAEVTEGQWVDVCSDTVKMLEEAPQ